jgi:hypothetical protein
MALQPWSAALPFAGPVPGGAVDRVSPLSLQPSVDLTPHKQMKIAADFYNLATKK